MTGPMREMFDAEFREHVRRWLSNGYKGTFFRPLVEMNGVEAFAMAMGYVANAVEGYDR